MEPLSFTPLLKQIRWGGTKLGSLLNKAVGAADDYAESWEIADHDSGQSVVAGGPFAGKTLRELIASHRSELLGRQSDMSQFPLLIKFLDANDWLSLQVHPNDRQALTWNPDEKGKTEAWIIVGAEPDSQICAGLQQGVTRDEFQRHLQDGTVENTLHLIPAVPGDCIYVPAQTVHAIGPGIVLAEVQQQSNLTFRLHDWGRVGADGKPREIHVEESLACIDFERGPVNPVVPVELASGDHQCEELVRCDYFVIRRHHSVKTIDLELDDRFRIVMVLDGRTELTTESGPLTLARGETLLLPASLQQAKFTPSAQVTFLEILTP
ncbi:MAG TPA: class I mannose-6-phosphate isomerase [Planctomycetes bacterium]|nr:class I mannose-6-phosphate isomerase [Fuerstiella sp.]HIK91274.1 class I mannose-6-phosphate isomerase [Planctomycetota bacterium]